MRILVMETTLTGARRGVHMMKALKALGHITYYLANVPVARVGDPGSFSMREREDGILAIEVPNPCRFIAWGGIAARIIIQLLNILLFTLAVLKNLRSLRHVDVIIARGMHPFTEPSAILLKLLSRAALVLDVCDPLAEELEVLNINRVIKLLLSTLDAVISTFIYAAADAIMTHNVSMVKFIRKYTCKKVYPIYNPIDITRFHPMAKEAAFNKLRGILPVEELEGKFVVLYAGYIGPCQDLGRVLDGAKLLKDDVVVVIQGMGEERELLAKRAEEEGIRNVLFWPFVPWEFMPYVLNLADACLLPLRDISAFSAALPKKFYEYIASGKPVICFCPRGEVTALVERWRAGVAVEPDDIEGLARAINWLSEHPELVAEMGKNARCMAELLFSLKRIGRQLDSLLKEIRQARA